MRRALFAALSVALFVACDSDVKALPTSVEWMEWPAEVPAASPFTVRMLVFRVTCGAGAFRAPASADQSAVTFSPYFLVKQSDGYCLPTADVADIFVGALDTAGTAPGLAATFPRSYEIRAAAQVFATFPLTALADLPVRTFGKVIVQPSVDPPGGVRLNAAGFASKITDESGCLRVLPNGLFFSGLAYVLEDQADTAGFAHAFVRGQLYHPSAPVCGSTTVIHLDAVN